MVVCIHNGGEHLRDQLRALAQQTYDGPWELVAVIDRCSDDSQATVESFAGQLPLRIVQVTHGTGLSNARNVGTQAATGDYLLFCDADDVADPRWLASMAAAAEDHPFIGGHIEEASLNDPLTQAWIPKFTPGHLPIAFRSWTAPAGANFGVSAQALQHIGGFDTAAVTGEEVDLAIRAQLLGYRIEYVPDAVMHYRHRTDLRALSRQAYRYGIGNAILYQKYRDQGVPRMTTAEIYRTLAPVPRGVLLALVRPTNRGAWLRYSSYLMGQMAGTGRRSRWIG